MLALCKEGSFEAVDKLVSEYYRNVDIDSDVYSPDCFNGVADENDNYGNEQDDIATGDNRPKMPRFLAARIAVLRDNHNDKSSI